MEEKKQVTYFYNAQIAEDETQIDMDGSLKVPEKGDIRARDGKSWKVEYVMAERSEALLTYKVYLSEV
jgi:hypothetical protein